MNSTYYRSYELPWTLSPEDERRFRRTLRNVFAVVLVLSVVIPLLPVPERDPLDVEEVPPRFAKLMLERQAPPPPPPPQPEPEELEPEPEPEPVAEEETPEPEPEPVPEPEPEPEPTARERASVAGLLPFADDLADLRDTDALDAVTEAPTLEGAGAGPVVERSLITSKVGKASSGINTARLSRGTGGGGKLAGRTTTKVASNIGTDKRRADPRRSGAGQKPSRSREEIELVFDRNKGAIYALYNRALRRDPTLQGKLVLRLTIAPSGRVTMCEVVSSELGSADLERKLVQRVLMFQFDNKDVEAITTTKPIDFFPA